MKLLTKFNLLLLVLFGTGGLIISQIIFSFLMSNARREVLQEARLMMASATSVRDYTSSNLGPLLEQNPEHAKRFLTETIPAFGAITTFNKVRQNYPDYTYREATMNPTNPEHRATDWETDVIARRSSRLDPFTRTPACGRFNSLQASWDRFVDSAAWETNDSTLCESSCW